MSAAAVRAEDLEPGMRVDVPEALVKGTDNEVTAEHEYALVEQVGGGWADGAAPEGSVVIYTTNFVLPIIVPADTLMPLEEEDPTPCCPDPECGGSPCTFPGYADNH